MSVSIKAGSQVHWFEPPQLVFRYHAVIIAWVRVPSAFLTSSPTAPIEYFASSFSWSSWNNILQFFLYKFPYKLSTENTVPITIPPVLQLLVNYHQPMHSLTIKLWLLATMVHTSVEPQWDRCSKRGEAGSNSVEHAKKDSVTFSHSHTSAVGRDRSSVM